MWKLPLGSRGVGRLLCRVRHGDGHSQRPVHERRPARGSRLCPVRRRLRCGHRAARLQALCCGGILRGRHVAGRSVVGLPERKRHPQRRLHRCSRQRRRLQGTFTPFVGSVKLLIRLHLGLLCEERILLLLEMTIFRQGILGDLRRSALGCWGTRQRRCARVACRAARRTLPVSTGGPATRPLPCAHASPALPAPPAPSRWAPAPSATPRR